MKDPAFLFYSDNFLSGTMFFSDEQTGKYIRLLCAQHLTGHLKENHMIFICKSFDAEIWSKFTKDDNGLYYNERLEQEIIKRKSYSESRSINKLGKTKDSKKNKIISKSYDNHMGNGNGNINVFEDFRLLFGGKKRGLETEFENFKKKHKDWIEVLPKLKPSIENQIKEREIKTSLKQFVPEWKNLQTWINQRCWEEEILITTTNQRRPKPNEKTDETGW